METSPDMFDTPRAPVEFDATERRILATLIEKSLATPDAYPLTLNALMSGCNQKSNRNPAMSLETFEVEGALRALQLKGAIGTRDRDGGRVTRYTHRLDEVLGADHAFLAILAELMLRGPQTTNELKNRIPRMGIGMAAEAIEERLRTEAHGKRPCVRLNPKRPGERYPRWEHLLRPEADAAVAPLDAATPAPASSSSPSPAPSLDPSPSPAGPAPAGGPTGGVGSDILARLAALEARVAELEARVEGAGAPDDHWHDVD